MLEDFYLASSITPRSELLSVGREEGHPVDVEGRSATLDSDDVVVLQDDRLPLHFVLQDRVDTSVHDPALGRVPDVNGPDETLINHFDSFRELGDVSVGEERSLVDVAEWSGLSVRTGNGHWRRLRRLGEQNFWRFCCCRLDDDLRRGLRQRCG